MTTKERVAELLAKGWKNRDIADEVGVSPARVSQLKAELEGAKDGAGGKKKTKSKAESRPAPASAKQNAAKPIRPPKKGDFQPGNPGGPGIPPEKARGNDNATKTGERRNPLLHSVSAERAALVRVTEDDTPADLIRRSIEVHQMAIADMTREIEAILMSKKPFWVLGTTYTRQEGDGEIMGTGRISQRKRVRREEAVKQMMEARARVQGKLDSAIANLHKMLTEDQGKRKRGLADLLAAMRQGGDDD